MPVDGFLVAGNDSGRKHHGIAGFDDRLLVILHGGAGQSRQRLSLAAGDQHGDLAAVCLPGLARTQQQPVRDVQVSQPVSDLGVVHHAAAN